MRDWFLLFGEDDSLFSPPSDRSIPQGEEEEGGEEAEEEATDRIILVSWVGKLTKDF